MKLIRKIRAMVGRLLARWKSGSEPTGQKRKRRKRRGNPLAGLTPMQPFLEEWGIESDITVCQFWVKVGLIAPPVLHNGEWYVAVADVERLRAIGETGGKSVVRPPVVRCVNPPQGPLTALPNAPSAAPPGQSPAPRIWRA